MYVHCEMALGVMPVVISPLYSFPFTALILILTDNKVEISEPVKLCDIS